MNKNWSIAFLKNFWKKDCPGSRQKREKSFMEGTSIESKSPGTSNSFLTQWLNRFSSSSTSFAPSISWKMLSSSVWWWSFSAGSPLPSTTYSSAGATSKSNRPRKNSLESKFFVMEITTTSATSISFPEISTNLARRHHATQSWSRASFLLMRLVSLDKMSQSLSSSFANLKIKTWIAIEYGKVLKSKQWKSIL